MTVSGVNDDLANGSPAVSLTSAVTSADRIAKLVPETLGITLAEAIEQSPDLRARAQADGQIAKLLETAQALEGITRHASKHAAGVMTMFEKKGVDPLQVVVDEAHEFMPNKGKTLATDPLVTILREGRQPGISLVLATQQPGKIHTDVMTQSDTIISHRITTTAIDQATSRPIFMPIGHLACHSLPCRILLCGCCA